MYIWFLLWWGHAITEIFIGNCPILFKPLFGPVARYTFKIAFLFNSYVSCTSWITVTLCLRPNSHRSCCCITSHFWLETWFYILCNFFNFIFYLGSSPSESVYLIKWIWHIPHNITNNHAFASCGFFSIRLMFGWLNFEYILYNIRLIQETGTLSFPQICADYLHLFLCFFCQCYLSDL